ncbi:MAG: transcription termination factor Rho [Nocardioides sp.]
MTDTLESTDGSTGAAPEGAGAKKRSGGLNGMLIADLKSMAGGLGIAGAGSMKKAELVSAIKAAQSGGGQSGGGQSGGAKSSGATSDGATSGGGRARQTKKTTARQPEQDDRPQPAQESQRDAPEPAHESKQESRKDQRDGGQKDRNRNQNRGQDRQQQNQDRQQQNQDRQHQERQHQERQQQERQHQERQHQDRQQQNQDRNRDRDQGGQADDGTSRSRRRRGRDRNRSGGATTQGGQRNEPDTTILEDDILIPAAGILDVLDNYAFVRTSGYLPGTDDVYLSLSMVRRFGLRRGDAVVGQVRQPREGERKEKFNPMVKVDSVNGADPETSTNRVEFAKLTPLYPSERLRLETVPTNLIGRVIDIAAPIGKGQRGLIVSPSKAGKTMIMQSIANSITTNNPECHLMVVLVDERPEEVTDFERSVKGEVISSTFDRPASDHTTVAELAIERAKRLVELGHDVVVLLDGITRLGRAYNLAAPPSGRILSGGVDSAALYPPKRFFGAARNIENGGSLTILATALIESGSKMDEVIFEEFKGTGNMEIRLRREFADKRLFPAIDAVQSGTRREELLMSKEELAIVWKLRRVLSGLDGQQALELLLERLKKSQSNIEFLMQVQKTTPGTDSD